MSSVDDRIVRMQLNNTAFERAAKVTLSTLDKLKRSISFGDGSKKNGLDNLQDSANRFSMGGVNGALDKAKSHWSAWRTAGLIAFATVVHQAVRAGERVLAAFTIDPIKAGFQAYQEQINATKTILSNVRQSGAGLKDVTKVLDEMQKYAQLTVYNFADMAKNVGTFTANGVGLKQAAGSIKGIANLAAMSGASSEDASRAMYQLSQAIGAGSVKLQDWNSVQNANLGTNTFKNALAETAVAMGTLDKSAVKFSGKMKNVSINGEAFRQSLTAAPGKTGWLTSKVLTNTLQQFTGDLTKAQLVAQGFTAQQAKAILATGKVALGAATQVKTWDQLTQALKEEVAGAYSRVFKVLFGNLPNATKLFSSLHTTLENLITGPINHFADVLQVWDDLGGRKELIEGLKAGFSALGAVLKPIKEAFRDIFPATTGDNLEAITARFKAFMISLKIGPQTVDNLKRTFRGLFALLDIGKQIVFGIFHVIGTLLGVMHQGSGNFTAMTGHVGDMVYAFDQMLKRGDVIKNFFIKVGQILAIPVAAFSSFKQVLFGLFDGWNQKDASYISGSLSRIGGLFAALPGAGSKLSNFFANMWSSVKPAVEKIKEAFHAIGSAITDAFNSKNFHGALAVLNTGLLAGIALMIRNFLKKGFSVNIGGGLFSKLGEVFEGLTGNLQAMQKSIQANTLLKIAGAIAILAASAVALALIDPKRLSSAMTNLAIGFGELLGAMKILTKISGSAGMIKMPIIAASLDLLAGAILILTAAVVVLSRLSWEQIFKGLTAITVLLGALSAAVIPLSANSAGMIRASIAIGAIAVALNLLYFAVKDFAKLSWAQLGKGLAGVGGSLTAIAIATRLMPRNLPAIGAGLLEISSALLIIYRAMADFAKLSWAEMAKGFAGIAGSLVAIAGAMRIMPKNLILQAAGLVIIGGALNIIAEAMASMGKLSWAEIGRGLTVLAGAMVILVTALNLLDGALPGAAAMLVVAGALAVLAPILKALGSMSWGSILKGLGALAGIFVVLGVAALAMTPVAPVLLAIGAAVALLGGGIGAAAAGLALLVAGLTALAAVGMAGIDVLLHGVLGFIKLIPKMAVEFAKGLVAMVVEVGKSAPKIATAIGKLIGAILKIIVDNVPAIADAALKLVQALLDAINNHISDIVDAAANIVVKFVDGIGKNIGKIIDAGVRLVISFLHGVADAIKNHGAEVITAILGIAWAIVQALFGGLWSGLKWLGGKLGQFFGWIFRRMLGLAKGAAKVGLNLLHHLWDGLWGGIKWLGGKIAEFFSWLWRKQLDLAKGAVKIGLRIVQNLWNGIWGATKWLAGKIGDFFSWLWGRFGALVHGAVKIGGDILSNLWSGINHGFQWLGDKISDFGGWLWDRFTGILGGAEEIGKNIVRGIWKGIKSLAHWLWKKAKDFATGVWAGIKSALGIGSPSKVAAWGGQMVVIGLANGIDQHKHKAVRAAKAMGSDLISALNDSMSKVPSALDGINVNPTITPVIDLTEVEKGVSQLHGMIVSQPTINAALSTRQAKNISSTTAEKTAQAAEAQAQAAQAAQIKFEQNNYSPRSLSTIDIYRQTKNQLAMAKKALGVSQ